MLQGHSECASFLEKTVIDLLQYPAVLCDVAQEELLSGVETVFTEQDNEQLLRAPNKDEVLAVLSNSNLHAAPGTDGLTNFFYKQCFEIVGDDLTEMVKNVFDGSSPTVSQRTSRMVFGCKPGKASSIKPGDKRRISLLNADFKIISGIESERLKKTTTWTLSLYQLVAGDDRRIHHGINLARDAIVAAGNRPRVGCGIADTDYQAAFDFLCMSWVFKVLEKKGLDMRVITRLIKLYKQNMTVIVVNNIEGKCVQNIRLSLRQEYVLLRLWNRSSNNLPGQTTNWNSGALPPSFGTRR